jgi:hypothetical protein
MKEWQETSIAIRNPSREQSARRLTYYGGEKVIESLRLANGLVRLKRSQ